MGTRDFQRGHGGIAIALGASMSRNANALRSEATNRSRTDADSIREAEGLQETRRLTKFQLEELRATVATGDDDDDAERTLTVAPAEMNRLFSSGVRLRADDETIDEPPPTVRARRDDPTRDARASADASQQETIDAPAPPAPARSSSPLGDEVLPPVLPELTSALAPEPVRKYEPVPELPLLPPDALARTGSGIRDCVTPERARAMREAREAARLAREQDAKTRMIVLAIWGAAVTLTGLLGFFALTP